MPVIGTWQTRESKHIFRFSIAAKADIDKDVINRTCVGWMKWNEASGVLCDQWISVMVKLECWKLNHVFSKRALIEQSAYVTSRDRNY